MKEPDNRSRRCFLKASSMLGLAAAFRPAQRNCWRTACVFCKDFRTIRALFGLTPRLVSSSTRSFSDRSGCRTVVAERSRLPSCGIRVSRSC